MQRFVGCQHPVGAPAFSHDGQFVLSGGEKPRVESDESDLGDVRLWNLKTGAEVRRFAAIGPVAFSPDGSLILTGNDKGAALWDANTAKLIRLLGANEPTAKTSPLPASSTDSNKTDSNVGDESDRIGVIETVAFSPDGRQALVVSNPILTGGSGGFSDGSVALRVWRCRFREGSASLRRAMLKPSRRSRSSGDNRLIIAGNALWSSITDRKFGFRETNGDEFHRVFITSLSADGRLGLTANSNVVGFFHGSLGGAADEDEATAEPLIYALWDLVSGKELARSRKLRKHGSSANGRFVLTMENKEEPEAEAKKGAEIHLNELTARLWEASGGKELWNFDFVPKDYSNAGGSYFGQTRSNFDWMFSPDGRYVMIEGNEDTVLLNVDDGEIANQFDDLERLDISFARHLPQ